jgi:hypothetical protein
MVANKEQTSTDFIIIYHQNTCSELGKDSKLELQKD